MSSDCEFMLLALEEARKAFDAGEVPIGAVAVRDGEVVARACNQVEALNSVTGHAEILLLHQLENLYHDWRISDVTVYVTKEPCPMCAGMLLNSRVKRLVFGVGDPGCGGCGGAFDVNALPGALWHFDSCCKIFSASGAKRRRRRNTKGNLNMLCQVWCRGEKLSHSP